MYYSPYSYYGFGGRPVIGGFGRRGYRIGKRDADADPEADPHYYGRRYYGYGGPYSYYGSGRGYYGYNGFRRYGYGYYG